MFSYISKLSEQQVQILKLVRDSEECSDLVNQCEYLSSKLELPSNKLVYKLIRLYEYGFIINERPLKTISQLGLDLTSDNNITCWVTEKIILTPQGIGYLETGDLLEQVINCSLSKIELSSEKKQSFGQKLKQEAKEFGTDLVVKLILESAKQYT